MTSISKSTFFWKSKRFLLNMPTNFGAMRLFCSGEVLVKIYADSEIPVFSADMIESGKVYRLPSGFKAQEWSIVLSGTGGVDQFDMATSVAELRV